MRVIFISPLGILCVSSIIGCDAPSVAVHNETQTYSNSAVVSQHSDDPRPSPSLIDKIERLLQKDPCVGNIERWMRFYSYGYDTMPKEPNTSIIAFEFREAGKFGFKSGRNIVRLGEWINLDDRSYKMLQGTYDLRSGRLSVEYCGLSAPPAD